LREGHPPRKSGESMKKQTSFCQHQFLVVVSKLLGFQFSGRVNKPDRFGPKTKMSPLFTIG